MRMSNLSDGRSQILTDSNSFWAEFPKMKEKPTMMVASGTSDAIVLLRLKMSKQMNTRSISTTAIKTASSLATAEPTSYGTIGQRLKLSKVKPYTFKLMVKALSSL